METSKPDEASIFAHARQIADAAARRQYVQQACRDDEALRARIEALLRAHEQTGHMLDMPIVLDPNRTAAYLLSIEVGAIIGGRYKLLEKIGEGGMGTVWVAGQTEPVRRKVALKLIKPGMDSQAVLARFEAERQALALMDHPHIAKVFDGGLTEIGRPFFVMEYVKGVPITEYCDTARLSVPERLALFVQVCKAVQHAHQKGIIHRDLKPSNILVAPYDGMPVPKVIDFGLAKAMHEPLTERTLHTAHGMVVGTPLYMSPEQAQPNNLDVDTRADIYSLGVVLYELLTGTTPLEKKRFKQAAWDEVRRILRDEDPPRPSTRLLTTDTAPSVAACRQSEPARLTRLMRGELDWIVMKALAKDRSRRYETASGLARDIERYMSNEPVEARPPSARYRLSKFLKRNRGPVLAAALLLLALVAGIIGTSWGLVRANSARRDAVKAQKSEAEQAKAERRAREEAQAAEKRALEQKQRAEANAQRALEEKRVADAVRDFLQTKLLGQADMRTQADALLDHGGIAAAADRNITVRELLDRAAAELAPDKLEGNFRGQPLLQAELLRTVGEAYRGVGELAQAVIFLERAAALCQRSAGPDSPQTLTTLDDLAQGYHSAGKLKEAIQLFELVSEARQKKLGPEHPKTIVTLDHLAVAYQSGGRLQESIQVFERVRAAREKAHGPDHPDVLPTLSNLAGSYRAAGNLARAIELYQQVRDAELKKLGPDHPDTLVTLNDLALALEESGKLSEAIELYEQAADALARKLGPENPESLVVLGNLARAYLRAGKRTEAVRLFEQVRDAQTKKLGPDHPHLLHTLNNLAAVHYDSGKLVEAIQLLEQVRDAQMKKLGQDNPDTLATLNNLAASYNRARQPEKSIPLYEDVVKHQTATLGRSHPSTVNTMGNLGATYRKAGRLEKAIPLLVEAYQLARPGAAIGIGAELQIAYLPAGKTTEATKLAEERLAAARQSFSPDDPRLGLALASVGRAWLDLEQYAAAEPIFRECLALREKLLSNKKIRPWELSNVKSLLGAALLGQKRFAAAEPLLQAGYDGLKQEENDIPFTSQGLLADALRRLIDVYRATGKNEEATKLQPELERIRNAESSSRQ